AQAFGTAGGVSLTAFLAQVRGSSGEVRRDMDGGSGNELRVMTIHGAKGLEAPVVVLPDMLKPRSARPDQLVRDPATGFVYWAPGTLRPDFVTDARDAAKAKREEEENRLLYVALTRARDGIVIGGWQSKSSRTLEGSHYEGLAMAINGMEGAATDDEGIVRIDEVAGDVPDVIDDMKTPPPDTEGVVETVAVPEWLFIRAPDEPRPPRPLRPSQPDGRATSARAPGLRIGGASAALARGRLAHKLFEVLPSVPETDRSCVEQLILATHREVPEGEAVTLAAEVREVMAMPALAPVFGMSAMAEVSVAGAVGGAGVAGQIDRLVVDETQVIVADFKTGARPSVTPADYHRQMALYAALLEQIYPDHEVVTWLVWTEDRSVEEIDRDTRDAALAALAPG
ncbi:MAG: 3'-5' exonuclease, partial [Alphaproteobacteria bacterium]